MTEFEKHILRLLIILIKQSPSGKIDIDDAHYVLTLEKELQDD